MPQPDPTPAVDDLVREWSSLRATGAARDRAIKELAGRVVAARSTLFERIARLQAEAPSDDDAPLGLLIESHQFAVKACTTVLTEMTAVLGQASIPS